MADERPVRIAWSPRGNRAQVRLLACPVFEVFFGGARGGGKTDGMLGEWASHADLYGAHAIGLMVRRERTQLVEAIERSRALFAPIGARLNEARVDVALPQRGALALRLPGADADADAYQGHSYTRVYVEEIGTFPRAAPVLKLMATLRSGAGVPVGFRATGNPGGPGLPLGEGALHRPGAARLVGSSPQPVERQVARERLHPVAPQRQSLPRRRGVRGNAADERPAGAGARLASKATGRSTRARSFRPNGSQRAPCGAAVRRFPPDWLRFRSGDWGSAAPFRFGWWAICDGRYDGRQAGAAARRAGALPRMVRLAAGAANAWD